MDLFETPGELRRRVGSVELGPELVFRTRAEVWLRGLLAGVLVAVFVGAAAVVAPLGPWPRWRAVAVVVACLTMYCAVGYLVRVRPNHDEMSGWSLSQELRVSDDINRGMLVLSIVLALGRFMSTSLVDTVMLATRGKLPQERYVENAAAKAGAPRT